jgi:hypothetical protein
VASASADIAPYLVPLSFDGDCEALLPSIAITQVYNRLNVPTRKVARAGVAHLLEEVPLNWNKRVRQIHRWLSIIFTVTVIASFVALAQEKPAIWVSYVPLLPLALLLFTGLYMFVLPHAAKWRSGRRTAHAQ